MADLLTAHHRNGELAHQVVRIQATATPERNSAGAPSSSGLSNALGQPGGIPVSRSPNFAAPTCSLDLRRWRRPPGFSPLPSAGARAL
jgi:hypothetical protein